MSIRFRSEAVFILILYGLLMWSIIPVSAVNTVNSEDYNIFEKLTVDVPGDQRYVLGEILVKFSPGISEEKIRSINTGHGTQITYTSPYAGFKILKIPATKTVEEMVEIYSKNPNVEYAVPNAIANSFMVPNDPLYKYQWNFKNGAGGINLEPAWDMSTGKTSTGDRVIVAVLDSGVAYEDYSSYKKAPDLSNTNFVSGYDFVNNDAHPNDDNSHGTHVAGTIAQSTNNNYGVAGVACDCSIMPVKVLNKQGSGTLQQLVDGIYFATNNGAKVISMSLGYSPGYYPGQALDDALYYAYDNGVTILAAAGNDATGTVSYPAAYEKCIAVGAINSEGSLSDYSNYGEALDVVAPGGDGIDRNGDGYGDGILQNTFNPTTKNPKDFGFWFFSGTSMATPHISGVAALLISQRANGPDEVRAAIESTTKDLGANGWDTSYGYGLINAKAALDYIQGQPPANNPPVAEAGGPYSGITGTSIAFDGSGSYDSDGSIISYYWDFDGDGITDSSEESPRWTYENAGIYTVTLTVTDNENAVGTDEATVTVTDPVSGDTIRVSDVSVETSSKLAGKNTFVSATAVVTVVDSSGGTVEGATVSGSWSGATGDLDSALTDSTGKATVYSDEIKYKSGTLTFTFTVNDVSHTIPWDGTVKSETGTYP
ncbi:MAG: serine protease [Euryarchaeota archaeon]|nr:serine protease [Euryarchaeota archaeon]